MEEAKVREKCIPTKDAQEMAGWILGYKGEKVNDKERDFLESLYENKYPSLTEAMSKWVRKIFDRVMK